MNYKRIYDQIILNRLSFPLVDQYVELHHITPKSLGGDDSDSNLVNLTAREHFICHYLLAKIYPVDSIEWYKMNHAFLMMKVSSSNQNRYINSHLYAALKNNLSKIMSFNQSGSKNNQYGTIWIVELSTGNTDKINNVDEIPDGWIRGRILPKIKICKNCNSEQCSRPKLCKNYQIINTLEKYFNFDKSFCGTDRFYDEYDRVVNIIKGLYYNDGLSVEQLKNKFNLTSNERMRKIMKSLGIDRRNISQAMKNYCNNTGLSCQ